MGSINSGQPRANNQDIEVLKSKHWSWYLEACYSIRAVKKLTKYMNQANRPLLTEAVAERRAFPSLQRRGGRDTNKLLRSPLVGADGVVSRFHKQFFGGLLTTPSARLRRLRCFSLIAQPPLLGEEGKMFEKPRLRTESNPKIRPSA